MEIKLKQLSKSLIIHLKITFDKSKLIGVSGLTLSLLKKGQGFKPRSRMKSSLWPALYPLWVDSVRTRISLGCGMDLKVPPTVVKRCQVKLSLRRQNKIKINKLLNQTKHVDQI